MKTLFSSLVAVVALSTSAFISTPDTSVPKANRVGAITSNYLIQPFSGTFTQLPSGTPSPTKCLLTSSRHCFYDVSSIGKDSIPNQATYSTAQIDMYVTKGWITPGSGSLPNKRYIP